MKRSLFFVLFFCNIVNGKIIQAQQPAPNDTAAFFPHWELNRNTKITTSFYVSNVGLETDSIHIQIFRENGTPLSYQSITLYIASISSASITTGSDGLVSFSLDPRQTARIDLQYKDLEEVFSFGYAKISTRLFSPNAPYVATLLAWGETISRSTSGWFRATESKASISVNGGSSFKLNPIF